MSLPVILRPETEADVREIYQYLEEVQIGLGDKFSDRLRELLQQIEAMPEMFGVAWRDVRAVRLRKFQYVVYYVVFVDRVEVLAVMHGARRESSWKARA